MVLTSTTRIGTWELLARVSILDLYLLVMRVCCINPTYIDTFSFDSNPSYTIDITKVDELLVKGIIIKIFFHIYIFFIDFMVENEYLVHHCWPRRLITESSRFLSLKSCWKRESLSWRFRFSCLRLLRSWMSWDKEASFKDRGGVWFCIWACNGRNKIGPTGVDIGTRRFAWLITCWGVMYTMRALLVTGADKSPVWRSRLWSPDPDGLASFMMPAAVPTWLPSFSFSDDVWCDFRIIILGVAKAAGSVGSTRTEAAKDETLARSRHSDPAVLSEPLPGTRTRDLIIFPVSYGTTILMKSLFSLHGSRRSSKQMMRWWDERWWWYNFTL